MNVTEKMISAAITAYHDEHHAEYPEIRHDMRQAIEAAIQAAPEVEQKPVASCKVSPLKPDRYQREFHITWKGGQPIEGDLYTHPKA